MRLFHSLLKPNGASRGHQMSDEPSQIEHQRKLVEQSWTLGNNTYPLPHFPHSLHLVHHNTCRCSSNRKAQDASTHAWSLDFPHALATKQNTDLRHGEVLSVPTHSVDEWATFILNPTQTLRPKWGENAASFLKASMYRPHRPKAYSSLKPYNLVN